MKRNEIKANGFHEGDKLFCYIEEGTRLSPEISVYTETVIGFYETEGECYAVMKTDIDNDDAINFITTTDEDYYVSLDEILDYAKKELCAVNINCDCWEVTK